jgi:hypothetical protein
MPIFIYDAPPAVTESCYGIAMGWYTDCDSAVCRNCAPSGFARGDFSEWGGFEGWEEPAAICYDDESDGPTHCVKCSAVITHDLTCDGTRYVLNSVLEFITDGSHTPDVMAQWWDAYYETFDKADLIEVIEKAMVAKGVREYKPERKQA